MSVTKWLHVEYISADPWVLPIWAAANQAAERGKVGALPDELAQLGLHVSTRLGMIVSVIQRVNAGARRIEELIATRELHHEFTAVDNGYAFRLPTDFKYAFLVDLDALLFEVNSCCELMGRLFVGVYQHAGMVPPLTPVGKTIRQVLEAAGQDAVPEVYVFAGRGQRWKRRAPGWAGQRRQCCGQPARLEGRVRDPSPRLPGSSRTRTA